MSEESGTGAWLFLGAVVLAAVATMFAWVTVHELLAKPETHRLKPLLVMFGFGCSLALYALSAGCAREVVRYHA